MRAREERHQQRAAAAHPARSEDEHSSLTALPAVLVLRSVARRLATQLQCIARPAQATSDTHTETGDGKRRGAHEATRTHTDSRAQRGAPRTHIRSLALAPASLFRCAAVSSLASMPARAGSSMARSGGSSDPLRMHLQSELAAIQAAGTFKNERVITTAQSNSIGVSTQSAKVLLTHTLALDALAFACVRRWCAFHALARCVSLGFGPPGS